MEASVCLRRPCAPTQMIHCSHKAFRSSVCSERPVAPLDADGRTEVDNLRLTNPFAG